MRAGVLLGVSLVAACAGPTLPDGQGDGLIAFDRDPPADAETFARPVWQAGDRFVYARGAVLRLPYYVAEAGEEGYVLETEDRQLRVRYTPDFWEIGEERTGEPLARRVDDPPEALYCWPLWVGKRWSCHVLRKRPGAPALPLLMRYHCDAREQVTVPAGTFDCLRIWRHSEVALEGTYLETSVVLWYAPAAGAFVRRLDDGVVVELVEMHRQAAGG